MPYGGGVYISKRASATGKPSRVIRIESAEYDHSPRRKEFESRLARNRQGPARLNRCRHPRCNMEWRLLNVGADIRNSRLIILAGFIAAAALKRRDAILSKRHH